MCDRQWDINTEPNVWTYADYNCQGYAWQLPVGASSGSYPGGSWTFGNDAISSLIVPPGKIAVMDHDTYPPGFYPGAWSNDYYSGANVKKTQEWADTVTDCCNKTKTRAECPGLPYGPNQPDKKCNPSMMKYCSKNPNIANSDICNEWYLENPTFKAQIMKTICTKPENMAYPQCREWCKQNPGECDNIATEFCKTYSANPFCTCLTSPVKKYNPACVDSECIKSGYITSSMKALKCPDVVDCQTQLDLKSSGRIISLGTSVEQRCGTGEGGEGNTTSKGNELKRLSILILILIVLIGLIGIGGMTYLIIKK
jgi:hypothetical protein